MSALDAFGRLRISSPYTIFNYYTTPYTGASNGFDQDVWVTNTSVANYSLSYNPSNYVAMDVSDIGYIVRKTKAPLDYQAGKSRLMEMSGVMLANPTVGSLTSAIGLMDTSNSTINCGVYFKTDGTQLFWCESLDQVETSVLQSNWNVDSFDGNGPSGLTLDSTNMQKNMLFVIDQEWLGVGRLRCGFTISGITYYAHEFTHNNMSVQYTPTPRLYLTYYLNVDTTTDVAEMRQMCCTAMLEGGFLPLGVRNSINTSVSTDIVALPSLNTKYIALGLKLNPLYLNGIIRLISISVAVAGASSTKMGMYEIQLHSTVGSIGSVTLDGISSTNIDASFTDIPNSIARQFIGLPRTLGTPLRILNDGYILSSGLVSTNSIASYSNNDFETLLTRSLCTQYDTLYLVVLGNAGVTPFAAMDFIESL